MRRATILRNLYLSPLGLPISWVMRLLGRLVRPFMVYGYVDKTTGNFRKMTRISSTAVIGNSAKVAMGDNVWIWHHSVIDGSNGVSIGDGVQIGAWCGIFTHGSHVAIRLLGASYIEQDKDDRPGYTRAPVEIGAYSFIGTRALIMPGAKIGKGCLVTPGSVVSGIVPDFAIAKGDPAKIVGDVREIDKRYLRDARLQSTYFDQAAMRAMIETVATKGKPSDAA
jgi:acetyltransferase-like isoleucine patch superfamily enzyme